jgi:hypothetical protein
MFSIYGSAHSGIFGAIIKKTNVEEILQLNCLATDFYRNEAYPTFLYYNPHQEDKTIEFFNNSEAVDLYDALTHKIIANNVTKKGQFLILGNSTRLIVALPTGSEIKKIKNKQYVGNVVIAYQ